MLGICYVNKKNTLFGVKSQERNETKDVYYNKNQFLFNVINCTTWEVIKGF